jgi:hypothetical protein
MLLYMGANCCRADYEEYIRGMWRGDDDFCKESDVSSMLLYLGDPRYSKGRVVRDGYLIINNEICNQRITIEYRMGSTAWGALGKYRIRADVEYEEEAVMPEKDLQFTFDMRTGMLTIHQGEKMYGVFFKDHELTDLSKATD